MFNRDGIFFWGDEKVLEQRKIVRVATQQYETLISTFVLSGKKETYIF